MVTSISEQEPQVNRGTSTVASESVRLTVTGLDKTGQMFREAAPILNLNGRDCTFRSKFQPEVGSWMLIEIDLSKQGLQRSTLQGQVRSVQAEGVVSNLFQVRVELESAQEVKIIAGPEKPQVLNSELPSKPVSRVNVEPDIAPKSALASAPVTEPNTGPATGLDVSEDYTATEIHVPANIEQADIKQMVTPRVHSEPIVPAPPVHTAAFDREEMRSAIASEVKEQVAALKGAFGQELERMAQRPVSSNIEQTVRQTIEKQISVSYQSTIQTLNSDLTFQLVGRIAGSEELRACIEKMAKGILEEQIASSRNSAIEAQQNLNAHVTEIARTFEASMDNLQGRLKIARDSATAVLDRVQMLEREATDGTLSLQKTVEQLNQAARSTIEKFDVHMTAQLNSWSAQFKKHLEDVSGERSALCATDLQRQLAAFKQDTTDVVEKLSAGLQLARGTLRTQEEQLAGLSRTAAVEFEKEIKAILLRLAGAA